MAKNWSRLDNAAKIFPPTSGKADTRVFRLSCTLTEPVDPDPLARALSDVMIDFPSFRYVLKRGLFWYYLEEGDFPATVCEEDAPPCAALYQGFASPLFAVTYYGARINLEVYHALTDATGALQFLRTLIYRYLLLRHPELARDGVPALDYDASRGLSYVKGNLNDGTIIFVSDCSQERDVVILDSKCRLKVNSENSVTSEIDVKVKRNDLPTAQDGMIVNALSTRERERICESIRGQVLACFEECQKQDIDIFHLGEHIYRKYGEEWRKNQNKLYIRNIDFEVKVDLEVK